MSSLCEKCGEYTVPHDASPFLVERGVDVGREVKEGQMTDEIADAMRDVAYDEEACAPTTRKGAAHVLVDERLGPSRESNSGAPGS